MKINNPRIESIFSAQKIGVSIESIEEFKLSNLILKQTIDYNNQKPLRLGKEIEKVVSALIKASSNFEVLYENSQIMDGKTTIGELDFIVKDLIKNEVFHLELVYKFYVYDPKQSTNELEKWIGPNRKDSFIEKYTKLKTKQFPLLKHPLTQLKFPNLNCETLTQKLCFMANLFVPFHLVGQPLSEINTKAIVGYWLSINDFQNIQNQNSLFYLPQKTEWGIHPSNNQNWVSKTEILPQIQSHLNRQFSPLCWIKKPNKSFEQCFIVWW